jgi:hypothetical protein
MATFTDLIDKSTTVLNIGFHGGKIFRVEVSLTRKEQGPALSIQGMIGRNHAGQIQDSIDMEKVEFLNGWDAHKLGMLIQVWNRWHNNDLRTGSPAQMQHLRSVKELTGEKLEWGPACASLRAAGLYVDEHFRWGDDTTGFRYGSAWVYEPLPESVIEWFNQL